MKYKKKEKRYNSIFFSGNKFQKKGLSCMVYRHVYISAWGGKAFIMDIHQ